MFSKLCLIGALILCEISVSLCIQSLKLVHKQKQHTSRPNFYINSYDDYNSDISTKSKIIFPNNKEPLDKGILNNIYRPNHDVFHIVTSSKYSNSDSNKDSVNGLKFKKNEHIYKSKFKFFETAEKKLLNSGSVSRANLIEALENISEYDDLQCVARLICDFLSEQKAKSEFPNFLLSPLFKNVIYNLPDTSPILLYGKAALLGISNDNVQCHSEYPQCPGNRDDLLYYLNNHRGGLFKFFNGDQTSLNQGRNEGDDESSIANLDFTNFNHIMILIKYMIDFFTEMQSSEGTEQNSNQHKITNSATRYGKIVNKKKNNYYSTQAQPVWKPYASSYQNNRPIVNNQFQLTTSNPNIYVTNSKGEIEYYINRLGQKVYVK